MNALTLLSLTGLLLLPTARAEKPVDQTLPAARDASVEIENVCGTVAVAGWDQELVKVTGTLDDENDEVLVRGNKSRIEIEVTNEKHRDLGCAQLKVFVPLGVRLELETVSADAWASGLVGALEIETVSGDVGVRGEPAEVEIETVSGEVEIRAATPSLAVETVSGDIEVKNAHGRLEAETVSGEVEIEGGPYARIQLSTVSGDVNLSGAVAPSGRLDLGTHSGDVNLAIGATDNAAWAISTFSGEIQGYLADRKVKGFGPGTTLAYLQGDGSTGITVSTHSGDINIEQK